MLLFNNFFKNVFIFNGNSVVRLYLGSFFLFKNSLYFNIEGLRRFCKILYFTFYYFIRKFSFVGKTYRFYKKKKKLRMFFNRAHKTLLYFSNFFRIKKKKKNKCKFLFLLYNDLGYFKRYIKIIRKQNLFTRRGIKINKMPVFKKVGKISTYR